jgi:hypothetical protein
VADERPNPVSGNAIAKHGIVVFTGGYEIVLVAIDDRGEIEMCDWSGMSMAGQRNHSCSCAVGRHSSESTVSKLSGRPGIGRALSQAYYLPSRWNVRIRVPRGQMQCQ